MRMTTKTAKVLEHLQTHGSITSMEAIRLYRATRLSSIIFNLRAAGYKITNQWEESVTEEYGKVKYVRYVLEQ